MKKDLSTLVSNKANKICFPFPSAWWLSEVQKPTFDMISDFRKMFGIKCCNKFGDCAMFASYADGNSTLYLHSLNSGALLPIGSACGPNFVGKNLTENLLSDLVKALGLDRNLLLEPVSAISKFWTRYPYVGIRTCWKAGYNFTDFTNTIRCPSLEEDVFIFGSDFEFLGTNTWIEGIPRTVDEVLGRENVLFFVGKMYLTGN